MLLLAPVTDPAAIPHALAAALDLKVVQGDVLAACVAVLGDRPGLLVIDNCEHLLDAVRDMVGRGPVRLPAAHGAGHQPGAARPRRRVRLPAGAAPAARATDRDLARRPLRGGLPRPGRPGPPRVRSRRRGAAHGRRHRAPARRDAAGHRARRRPAVHVLPRPTCASRLDRSLDLLGGGRPSGDARHRTLRATVEWSYQLLSEDEQRLFRHLSVFVDGVDLDTAERLAADLGLGERPRERRWPASSTPP